MANIIPVAAGPTVVGPIPLPNHNGTVALQLQSDGAPAGLNVKVQGRLSNRCGWSDIKLTDPASKTDVATLTTKDQIGWFENIGYNEVQFVQTGAVTVAAAEVILSEGVDG